MERTNEPRKFRVAKKENIRVKVIAHNNPLMVTFGKLRGSQWHSRQEDGNSVEQSFTVTDETPDKERFDLFMDFVKDDQGQVAPDAHYKVLIEGDKGPDTYEKDVGPDVVLPAVRRYRFVNS